MGKSSSEVHAYVYIIKELTEKKGWSKNQIYTQGECLEHPEIKKYFGQTKPENVCKISEKYFYIIEAKNNRNKIDIALKEARQDYADKLNCSDKIKSPFITGIAGNHIEGFICKSQYLHNNIWETIKENDVDLTGLLSILQIQKILDSNNPNIKDVEITDQEFLKSAEKINGILHEGGINKDTRAKVISSLLLALVEGTELNLDESPIVLIQSINARVDLILKKHNKSDFSRFIKIELPSSEDNHIQFKKALVLTIQELLGLNIRSAMRSGKDILGKFYEVFLKYGNGAKEIGIVLTPRHITKLAAEAIDIQANDLVLDPTCGTGGFLVAAFDEVKKKTRPEEFENFRLWGLYGVESQDPVVALALVNMIFRGDGKNNIIEGNCLAKWLNATNKKGIPAAEYLSEDNPNRIPPITKVLMNPPFPKKKTDYKEYFFIEQALKQMQNDSILFSVLPYSCMVKGESYLNWRKRLLQNNTLLSVVTFPEDLFYPVGVHTVGVFIKKGAPHKSEQKVLWIRLMNDGYIKSKGKRLENNKAKNDIPALIPLLKSFISNQKINVQNIRKFTKAMSLDLSDENLELVPEAYLEQEILTESDICEGIEKIMRETAAFLIKTKKECDIR